MRLQLRFHALWDRLIAGAAFLLALHSASVQAQTEVASRRALPSLTLAQNETVSQGELPSLSTTKDASMRQSARLGTPGEKGGTLGSAFYVRTDSDKTTVITPSISFRKTLGPQNKTGVSVGYLADVWSSASIDIRSAASERVVEQRDEVVAAVDHEQGLWGMSIGYRNSFETDYLSNSLTLSAKYEAFGKHTTFEGRISGALDRVGRSGDATFSEGVQTVSTWFGVTQVMNKNFLLQFSAEYRWSGGFLSSPYRYVPIGTDMKNCKTPAGYCLPEAHPGMRSRVAAVLRSRYALSQRFSVGAGYRFYYDQWKLQSNTGTLDLSANLAKGLLLSLDGRIYQQSAAFFYRASYTAASLGGEENSSAYITRDRELSKMWNWRAGLRAEYESPLSASGIGVKAGFMSAVTQYHYPEFVGLDTVNALELAGSLGVVF